MSAVPLEGFDPRFLPSCSKCGSHMLNFQWGRHPFMWAQKELRSSCYACGTIKYGENQIREAFEPSFKRWLRAQEEERLQNEQALQREREYLLREQEELRIQKEQEELFQREEDLRIAREREEVLLLQEREVLLRKEEEKKRALLLQKRAQQKREQRARKREKEALRKAAAEKQRQYARDLVRRGEEIKAMVQSSLQKQLEEKKRILLEEKQGAKCAWDECENLAAPTSKYCSRTCSNKRARLNYRMKKSEE